LAERTDLSAAMKSAMLFSKCVNSRDDETFGGRTAGALLSSASQFESPRFSQKPPDTL
jgi:hypothetical protein